MPMHINKNQHMNTNMMLNEVEGHNLNIPNRGPNGNGMIFTESEDNIDGDDDDYDVADGIDFNGIDNLSPRTPGQFIENENENKTDDDDDCDVADGIQETKPIKVETPKLPKPPI
eukprot:248598_1